MQQTNRRNTAAAASAGESVNTGIGEDGGSGPQRETHSKHSQHSPLERNSSPPTSEPSAATTTCVDCSVAVMSTSVTILAVLILVVHAAAAFLFPYPTHAQCDAKWQVESVPVVIADKLVAQIKKWGGPANCAKGGEKCLYQLVSEKSDNKGVYVLKANHTTPVKHYVDDLTFTLSPSTNGTHSICNIHGFSTSRVWYAVLDSGTNFCNLKNLITGSGIDKLAGYKETTSDKICTQYTSADCSKY